ncbi:MAG: hypothetical protein OXI87_12030 [Albidovulum sp.]|nr:hypothetical protein [Albidovulum sp.]MDE0533687.1 hypothetical protein [Albidovulum sp.]
MAEVADETAVQAAAPIAAVERESFKLANFGKFDCYVADSPRARYFACCNCFPVADLQLSMLAHKLYALRIDRAG